MLLQMEEHTADSPQQLKRLVLVEIPSPPPVRLQRHVGKDVIEILADKFLDAPVVTEHGIEHEEVLGAVPLLLKPDDQH